jgi:hypothetical protein
LESLALTIKITKKARSKVGRSNAHTQHNFVVHTRTQAKT